MLAGWGLITFCSLSLHVGTVICSDWLHDMVLYRLNNVPLWQWCGALQLYEGHVFSRCGTQSQRFSPDLSCNGSGDRGLVAARSGRTCHLAFSLVDKTLCLCNTATSARNLADFNMARGLVNAYSMTVSALCSVWASSHCARSNTRAADTDVLRPGDHHSNPAPFYFHTFSHTSHIHLINWMSVKVSLFFQKQPPQRMMPHNAFSAWSFFINKQAPLSQSVGLCFLLRRSSDFLLPCLSALILLYWLWFKCLLPIRWAITHV